MTIFEVCKKLDLTQDTLRYYERIGLIPKIEKSSGGFREYTEQDCQRITIIKFMRNADMPIQQLTQYIEMIRNGGDTLEARKNLLRELRERLAEKIGELQTTLHALDERIDGYERRIAQEEENLFIPSITHSHS